MADITRQNKIAYNYLAESYTKEWAKKPDVELAEAFIKLLPTNAHILDIGCGPGHYSLYFHERGFIVDGVDFSENMVSIAKAICKDININIQDMRCLNFEEDAFDALWVCSSFVHIHKEEAIAVLTEFKRILKKQGVLFINAIIGDSDYRLETEDEIGGTFKGDGRYFQWYPNSRVFEELLDSAGFAANELGSKLVTSQVVKKAICRTNQWVNYICRLK
ncbi:MAG: class I SAM-dependent methyltransferase [Peptococcaceae bacterium]|jgi:SAM-dependent methyltransferase|nr:class I SAM-dependent methyltransferase [Peptococcaceae bacterium]